MTDCRDPKDNTYLGLACAAAAATIVSSDDDLPVLHPCRGVRILKPAAYVAETAADGRRSPLPAPSPAALLIQPRRAFDRRGAAAARGRLDRGPDAGAFRAHGEAAARRYPPPL